MIERSNNYELKRYCQNGNGVFLIFCAKTLDKFLWGGKCIYKAGKVEI